MSKRKATDALPPRASNGGAASDAAAAAAPAAKRPAFASAAAAAAAGGGADGVKSEASVKREGELTVKQEPAEPQDGGAAAASGAAPPNPDDDADADFLEFKPNAHLAGLKRDPATGHIVCPYLDTINRRALDFDFEQLCSVSLANTNVYACLVCGRYFQGRGRRSHAYAHALDPELEHHVFINLATEELFCLPDGYQIFDKSLEDIQYNLHPRFSHELLSKLDKQTTFIHALDGTDYLPGLVGLNNIKQTDWLNVIVQALNFLPQWRNYFLVDRPKELQQKQLRSLPGAAKSSAASASSAAHSAAAASSSAATASAGGALVARSTELADKYGELLAKVWNPRSFKGHVSPHELLQCVSTLSAKRFQIGKFADALQVLSWMLNHMHKELAPPGAAGKKKKQAGGAKGAAAAAAASASSNSSIGTGSIVHQTFQGEIKITTTIKGDDAAAAAAAEAAKASAMDTSDGGAAAAASAAAEHGTKTTVEHKPFLYLSLALPAAPLFKDASTSDRAIIPQVPLFELLKKFDGVTVERGIDPATKREFERTYTITRLPRYLLLHYQRFHENNWFFEKNPTLVNFPLQRMDMRPYTSPSSADAVDLTAENGPSSTTEALRALPVAELKRLARAKGVPNVDRIVEKDELVRALQQQQNVAGTAPTSTYYNLLSNIVHEGVVGAGSKSLGGSYKCFSLHRATNTWYLTEDLHVHTSETMEQQVALTESYIQIYERQ